MFTVVAIPLTCWLCALVASPRRPRFGNEVEELVYSRLLGRQQLVTLLAIAATAIAAFVLVITLATSVDPAGVSTLRGLQQPDLRVVAPAWDARLVIEPRMGNG
jgi:hypothetical protein